MDIHDYFHDASEKLVLALTIAEGENTRLDSFLKALKTIVSECREDCLARVLISACIPESAISYEQQIQEIFSILSGYEDAELKKLAYRQGNTKVSVDYGRYEPVD
jgi:hypothetical protein